jgi:hypothetical protein
MEVRACSSRFSRLFMLFQVNVVAQEKRKKLPEYEMKWGKWTSNHSNSTEKELNAEKIFFKEEFRNELSGITTDKKTTN